MYRLPSSAVQILTYLFGTLLPILRLKMSHRCLITCHDSRMGVGKKASAGASVRKHSRKPMGVLKKRQFRGMSRKGPSI